MTLWFSSPQSTAGSSADNPVYTDQISRSVMPDSRTENGAFVIAAGAQSITIHNHTRTAGIFNGETIDGLEVKTWSADMNDVFGELSGDASGTLFEIEEVR